ncbi:UNVERIFIED_CONTAM: Proteasome subunit beta type-7-A [Sesamum radiatum]|uniref:Proteasome subunit beta type-7-A n=1 Tax=Sesamum radiatum TaxID=300843 RepID=A0AAW2MZU5_SESRA
MSTVAESVPPKGGFSFDLCRRNEMLVQKGLKQPSFLKTGTTIVGLIFQLGLLLSKGFANYDGFFLPLRMGLFFVRGAGSDAL